MLSFIRRNRTELLIGLGVICVVTVLAAILSPAVNRSPLGAKRIACINNLTQIGTALAQYMQENDETFPRMANGKTPDGKDFTWRLAAQPYLKDVEAWKCPINDARHIESTVDGLPLSYETTDVGPIRRGKPIKMANLKSPTQTIVVFEEEATDESAQQYGVSWDKDDGSEASLNVIFAAHLGTSNFLFADGHAKSMRPTITIQTGNWWHVDTRAKVTPRVKQKVELATIKAAR